MAYITSQVSAHTGDTSDAHDASAISVDSTTLVGTGTDVQAVLEELDNGIADHLADTSDAHDASAISVLDTAGNFTGTDVEAVLAELAASGGGSMPMPPVCGTLSWNCLGAELAALKNSVSAAPASATWPANNRAIYMPLKVTEDCTVVKLWLYNGGTANANINMCLYDSAFAQVANSEIGSTAQAGTNVLQEFDITDVALTAGTYYIACVLSATTGTVFRFSDPAVEMLKSWGMCQEALAGVDLPATATPADIASAYLPIMGISTRTLVA